MRRSYFTVKNIFTHGEYGEARQSNDSRTSESGSQAKRMSPRASAVRGQSCLFLLIQSSSGFGPESDSAMGSALNPRSDQIDEGAIFIRGQSRQYHPSAR